MSDEIEGIPGTTKGTGLRVSRRTRIMGLTGLGHGLPRPIEEGTEQRVLVEIPDECPSCGSAGVRCAPEPGLGLPRRVSCFSCGWDSFLVRPPQAPVVNDILVERGYGGGHRVLVPLPAPAVRAAAPRRVDRRKRRRIFPEGPPKTFPPTRTKSGGVEVFP